MTEPDYPAAHSMDTLWYAVDANGAVAIFDTGSAGPVPKSAAHREQGHLGRLVRILGGDAEDDDFDFHETLRAAADLGVYAYQVISWECDLIDTYERVAAPKQPRHLDQLPPKLRKNFARCALPLIDFATEEELQVVTLAPCDLYWDGAVACFAPGHQEAWPIPGKEKEYQAALPQLRQEYPDFRFADPAAPPRTQPPPLPKRE